MDNSIENLQNRAENEIIRLTELLEEAGVSRTRKKGLVPVVENVAFMKVKLEEARAAIKNSNIAIQYDNGGGQKGIRENPLFKGYESLWKSYMVGMTKILDALPPEQAKQIEQEETDHKRTVLELVRAEA